MRSSVRVQVQVEFTPKGGKDQSATTKHSQGPTRKDRSSYSKTSYLDHGDDDAKKATYEGKKSKLQEMTCGGRQTQTGRNWAQASRPMPADPPHFLASFTLPFDLGSH
jgi:hypothetical protein